MNAYEQIKGWDPHNAREGHETVTVSLSASHEGGYYPIFNLGERPMLGSGFVMVEIDPDKGRFRMSQSGPVQYCDWVYFGRER